MKTNKIASVKIVRNNRPKKGTKLYKPALRITYNRIPYLYIININGYSKLNKQISEYLTIEDFKELEKKQVRKNLKEHQFILNEIEHIAITKINSIENFSLKKFEEIMFGSQSPVSNNIFSDIENTILTLTKENRIGTTEAYATTLKHLKSFHKPKELKYSDITTNFLNLFEKWLYKQKNLKSPNTVGKYMRDIRTMFNIAIANKVINQDFYPFGKGKYIIPNRKKETIKILDKEEIDKIKSYSSHLDTREKAKDLWLFCYFGNGMYVSDLIRLKHSNIKENRIYFTREKTKNTTKGNQITIEVRLNTEMKKIIKKYGNINKDSYLFPFIDNNMDEFAIKKEVAKLNQFITKNMKRIALEIGINNKITAEYSRHSFATILRNSGIEDSVISKALGHTSIDTTSRYLGKFSTQFADEFSSKL